MTPNQKQSLRSLHDLLEEKVEMIANTLEDENESWFLPNETKSELHEIVGLIKDAADKIHDLIARP